MVWPGHNIFAHGPQDGSSNWLKGVLLLVTYFFVAAGFWCHTDPDLQKEEAS